MTEPRRTGIEAGLVGRVAAGVRYIVSGVAPTDWFGPMQPMAPVAPPDIAGRSFDFPVGANLRIQPRPDETISFADLRGLADGYDLLRLVIETRKDQIAKLDWTIRPRDSRKSGAEDPRLKAIVTAGIEIARTSPITIRRIIRLRAAPLRGISMYES